MKIANISHKDKFFKNRTLRKFVKQKILVTFAKDLNSEKSSAEVHANNDNPNK